MSSESPASVTKDDRLETLRRTYERVCDERDRLRNARGFFARALGPIPASAGISTALVATFVRRADVAFLWSAVGTLAIIVVVGIVYGVKPAYRHLYARKVGCVRRRLCDNPPPRTVAGPPASYRPTEAHVEDLLAPEDWYRAMIDLERMIYGGECKRNRFIPPWRRIKTLQDGLDAERTGVWLVDALWIAVIALLVASVLA